MGMTKIFVTKDKNAAAKAARYWVVGNPSHQGVVVADTDAIAVADVDGNPVHWQSQGDGPWYIVLATPDSIVSGTGPAAQLTEKEDEGAVGENE